MLCCVVLCSVGHVASHPAVRVRAARGARPARAALAAARRRAAPAAASALLDDNHHQLLRSQTQVTILPLPTTLYAMLID